MGVRRRAQVLLEAHRLLPPERLEVAESDVRLKAINCSGSYVQCRFTAPLSVPQPFEVFALYALVFSVVFSHGLWGPCEVTIQGGAGPIG